MDFKHKNHLISTYITFHKQLKEIRDIICSGNAPSGTNAVLTPLSEKMQNDILFHLEKITVLFDEIAHKYFSEELQAKLKKRTSIRNQNVGVYTTNTILILLVCIVAQASSLDSLLA